MRPFLSRTIARECFDGIVSATCCDTRVFAVDGGPRLLSYTTLVVYHDHAWVHCAQYVRHNTPVVCARMRLHLLTRLYCLPPRVCVSHASLGSRLTVYVNGPDTVSDDMVAT